MSRQFRQRVTAIALSGLIFGAPMLVNGTANAQRIPEGARQVTFSGGGMLGLSCRSRPDVESMTVPAQSTIRVVNRTGYAAKLLLGGDTKGTLPDDSATDVIFRRGTTAVTLEPNCPIGDQAVPMLVTAQSSAPAAALPDPIPAPSSGGPEPVSMAPSGSREPSGAGMSDSAASGVRPARVNSAASRPGTRRPVGPRSSVVTQAATAAVQSMPHGGTAAPRPKIKSTVPAGTGGSAAPGFAGMPPGEQRAVLTGVPQIDLEPVTAGPAAPSPGPTEVAAAEPVATMAPMSDGGPIGLLALIAAVCVVGVGVATIRAIVSQRANRAKLA
ncbi:hypothetical protein Ade02nite_76070 [Paractinoplanes deccanensis]|uniref:Uncharacterized protein n=1 Tax=Paractinoplanes deccanensis TaxID=113561 RepID=A0ABQ3YG29_9ACTN|nr:hypothetical protein [Actinoplanes deccanensis]GID78966.1 hypothetical protein Ade02nite_76070 [Actinoplanes deccanensis]